MNTTATRSNPISPPRTFSRGGYNNTNAAVSNQSKFKHAGDLAMSSVPQMTNNQIFEIEKKDDAEWSIIDQVSVTGDLSKLTPKQRVMYFNKVCNSMGLNPLTRPLDYITLNGKLTLYATKNCAEQLRKLHGISIYKIDGKLVDDLYIVTAGAKDSTGRTDESTAALSIGHLKGEAKANAIMKCETKAKRRVTLSIAGMGLLDETETDTIPGAKPLHFDPTQHEEEKEVALKVEEVPDLISKEQLNDLEMILSECDEKFINSLFRRLDAEYKIYALNDIPVTIYNRVKDGAVSYMEKLHAKQRAAAEETA
jgi:hypothetical protein